MNRPIFQVSPCDDVVALAVSPVCISPSRPLGGLHRLGLAKLGGRLVERVHTSSFILHPSKGVKP